MDDLVGMSAWGVVAGTIVGIVLHFNVTPARRQSVVRWCLLFGGASLAFFVALALLDEKAAPTKAAFGMGFIGFPALVAGLLMVGFELTSASARQRNKETPGV